MYGNRVDNLGNPVYSPAVKYGWADDDGSGDQVFGKAVATAFGPKRRRKFGKILSLRENGLITGFNTLPSHVERDMLYKDCLLYTSPSPRDRQKSRMPSSA